GDQVVQIRDVSLMVLTIVKFQGFLGNVRLERVHFIGKWGKRKCHILCPLKNETIESLHAVKASRASLRLWLARYRALTQCAASHQRLSLTHFLRYSLGRRV